MNNKKCKKLRKYVRETIPLPSETSYKPHQDVKFYEEVDEVGVVHLKRSKGIPRALDLCQRNVYGELKNGA